jgi:hypothetical protein
MSQSAKKRPTPPTETPVRDEAGSGRYVIGPSRRIATMLPPRDGQADEVLSLDAVGGLELPDAIDATPPAAPNTVSGVFSSGEGPRSDAEADPIADGIGSMRPYYTAAERKNERAELIVEDLGLRFDNPYGVSSLVPPPRKPLSIGKILGVAAALLALGSGASFATQAIQRAQLQSAPVAVAPHVIAGPQAQVAIAAPSITASVKAKLLPQADAPIAVQTPTSVNVAPVATATSRERVQAQVAHPANDAVHSPASALGGGTVEAALKALLKNQAATPAPTAPAAGSVTAAANEVPAAPEPTPAVAQVASAVVAADTLGALPDLPTRDQIVAGFEQARAAIDTCAGGKHGLVKIDATIANSGHVANARVDGVFVGTPEGSCIARAVRTARFPAFSQASLKVS